MAFIQELVRELHLPWRENKAVNLRAKPHWNDNCQVKLMRVTPLNGVYRSGGSNIMDKRYIFNKLFQSSNCYIRSAHYDYRAPHTGLKGLLNILCWWFCLGLCKDLQYRHQALDIAKNLLNHDVCWSNKNIKESIQSFLTFKTSLLLEKKRYYP